MSTADGGAAGARSAPRRSRWAVVGWIVGALLLVGALGFVWVILSLRSAFPPLPDLYRPAGTAGGSLRLNEAAGPQSIAVRLRVSSAAATAAAAGDGLVHLELDVAGDGDVPIESQVGVRWLDAADDVRPLSPLEAGADVRWTMACPRGDGCERLVDLTFGPGSGRSSPAPVVEWRLVAEVRPKRGTEVPADAVVALVVVDPAR